MAADGPGGQPLFGNDVLRGALRQQPSVGDVRQLVAAFGLVHVVRADQHRYAARRQFVQLLPEVAPRGRIHARGGFVQQQQPWLVQQAGRQRQALLPAAGQRSRQLFGAALQAQVFQCAFHGVLAVGHAIHARHEIQVLSYGQVVPVGELLRHVAHVPLDLFAVAQDVVAQAGAAAGVRCQQAAHQADRRGLAAAVGAQEAEDLAFAHLQRHVVDDVLVAEALVQAVHIDDVVTGGCLHGGGRVHCSVASTGCPGCSRVAASGAGRACTI